MDQNRLRQYMFASKEFYEPISRYQVNDGDYRSLVSACLPEHWCVVRYNYWYSCSPVAMAIPPQGWKIHISTQSRHSRRLLKAVVPLLVEDNVPFKYIADAWLLRLHNAKFWPRAKSGKFITAYPGDEEHFVATLRRLHEATKNFSGPRVLSDRRYPDSSVLHYRYGTFRAGRSMSPTGERRSLLIGPDGSTLDDKRVPYFKLPSWVQDPICSDDTTTDSPRPDFVGLKNGRYHVQGALAFSNAGGVYRASDRRTNAPVVVKEARPHVGARSENADSVAWLKKEHRVLEYCRGHAIAPSPIDLFEQSGHWFLVQEYFAGITLYKHSARTNPILFPDAQNRERQDFLRAFRSIFLAISRGLQLLHNRGVVVGDISPNNVLVRPDSLNVRLIDFETAYEPGVDEPIPQFTPGFMPPEHGRGRPVPQPSGDVYGLGALMSSYLYPVNGLYVLNPAARTAFVAEAVSVLRFPREYQALIVALTADDPLCRPPLDAVVKMLDGPGPGTVAVGRRPRRRRTRPGRLDILRKRSLSIARYICDNADTKRSDRLFPADPQVYENGSLSLAYGACGVAYVLREMLGSCPQSVVDWILDRTARGQAMPAGLYVGSAGVAWVLDAFGAKGEARSLLEPGCGNAVLDAMDGASDIFFGVAGWGMANLKLFVETRDCGYLANAIAAGQRLRATRREDERGCYWPLMGRIHHGLAHGASGVALFFLYLYLASEDETWLEDGHRALSRELQGGIVGRDGGLSWPRYEGGAGGLLPYWRHGSAGVGMVVARYILQAGADDRYREALDKIVVDAKKLYTVQPGMCYGLAGLGHFMLDLRGFCGGDARFEEAAWGIADTIGLFEVPRTQGTAIPGEGLGRISCDLATGGAGVGLFLHRLRADTGAPFMVDELLPAPAPVLKLS